MQRRDFLIAGSAASLCAVTPSPAQTPTVLRRVVSSELTSLDPQRPTGQVTAEMAAELFAGLAVTDAAGKVVPGCAESWSTSADGLTSTFRLRRNLSWSDGTPLTARDFVYTLRRYLHPATGAAQAARLDSIVGAADVRFGRKPPSTLGVSAPDPTTLVIRLRHPDVELPVNLVTAYCVPEHVISAHGREWAKPTRIVSNGPYRLESWAAGAKDLKLRLNPHFYAAADVAIEHIEWLTGYDDSTRLRLFRLGQADIASIEDMANYAAARRELGTALRSSPECSLGAIGINTARAPLDQPELRRALSLAVDRDVLVSKVRGLGEQPWYSVLPPGIPGYPALRRSGDSSSGVAQRLSTARELVRQSVGSSQLRLGIGFPTSPTGRKMYLAVAAMWKRIGVDLELLPLDGRAYSAALQRGDYDLFSYAAFAVVPSASNFLLRFVSDSSENVTRYRNAAFDRVVMAAERQLTLAARYAGYGEAEALLLRDVPLIPLWAGNSHRLVARRVRGWTDHPGHSHQSRYLSLAG